MIYNIVDLNRRGTNYEPNQAISHTFSDSSPLNMLV